MLAKIAAEAPDLAALLRKSLDEGFISPDIADALMLAAHHINEDVADALMEAGRHINQDVADRFSNIGYELNETTGQLNQFLTSLRETAAQLSGPQEDDAPDYQLKGHRTCRSAYAAFSPER